MRITMRMCMLTAAVVVTSVLAGLAAPASETFTATAALKSPQANATAPVTITIDRFVSAADRERILGVVKANDAAATQKALAGMTDVGFVQVGKGKTPIKYAYATPSGDGRLITVVTAAPIAFVGGSAVKPKPREGYGLGLALLVVDGSGKGEGEISPATKIKTDEKGAIVTQDYSGETIHLTGISKTK